MENSVQDDSSTILFSPIFQVSVIFRHLFSQGAGPRTARQQSVPQLSQAWWDFQLIQHQQIQGLDSLTTYWAIEP